MEEQAINTLEDFEKAFEAMAQEKAGDEHLKDDDSASTGTPESSAVETGESHETAPADGEEKALNKEDGSEEEIPSKTQYDTLRGRLREADRTKNALQQQNEQLKRELEAKEEALKTRQNRQPVEIDEDLEEDIKVFEKRYPQLAEVVKEESLEGDEARRILAELGAEQAMIYARTVVVEKASEARVAKIKEEFDLKKKAEYWGEIYEEVPEVSNLSKEEAESFLADLQNWIKDQPREKREELEPVFNGFEGIKPRHVIKLYKSFFDATKSGKSKSISEKAKDAEAIPSRSRGSGYQGRSHKRDLSNPADFEAAFNELAKKDSR